MICYTRNFEDVILQRVFADIPLGRYVDVGACMPKYDSNTYGLYTKGWAGLAVEPLMNPASRAEWDKWRPRDALIEKALGQEVGVLDFHVFSALQTSTGSKASIKHWLANGAKPLQVMKVPQTTLQQLADQYLTNVDWHLLSIDVEGMEFDVIQGLNWTMHRPWVVVLEAVLPGNPAPNHHQWEPWLLAQDYQLALFDGVNRFYVAKEHKGLMERFVLPPNVWDRFDSVREIELHEELRLAQVRIAQMAKAI